MAKLFFVNTLTWNSNFINLSYLAKKANTNDIGYKKTVINVNVC